SPGWGGQQLQRQRWSGAAQQRGRNPGIQAADQQLFGRVWPQRRRGGQCHYQIGHEQLSRERLRILPKLVIRRARLLRRSDPEESLIQTESIRGHVRWTDQERQAFLV